MVSLIDKIENFESSYKSIGESCRGEWGFHFNTLEKKWGVGALCRVWIRLLKLWFALRWNQINVFPVSTAKCSFYKYICEILCL